MRQTIPLMLLIACTTTPDAPAGSSDESGSAATGSPTTAAEGTTQVGSSDGTATSGATSSASSESSAGESSGSATGDPPGGGLTDAQRIAFAHYYSPVILKKAAESSGTSGLDWITNFDFDRDNWQLSNNRENWEDGIEDHVDGGNPTWRIRPTLYTAIIEFDRGGNHSIVLLYHVYHAFQGDGALEDIVPEAASIHDWERIEVRIDGVSGDPGTTDTVNYVVVTSHSNHVARLGDSAGLNFVDTAQGHHPMIFQAEHDDPLGVGFAELRFSETSADALWAQTDAEVNVNDAEDQNFHYIYVSEGDPELIALVEAQRLSSCNAASLASSESGGVALAEVPRIVYEHQDLADVLLSHWDDGLPNTSWEGPSIPILLDEPLLDEAGVEEVPDGLQIFHSEALDDLDNDEDRRGYPRKHWFWGTYLWDGDGNFWSEAFEEGTPNGMRCVANGHADCLDNFFAQHDYYAHIGVAGDGTDDGEQGEWLPAGWNAADANGFDGRFIQLFDDAVDRDCD